MPSLSQKDTVDPQSLKKFKQLEIDYQRLNELKLPQEVIDEAYQSILHPGKGKKSIKTFKTEKANTPTLFVFRHGESIDNQKRVFSGWHDSDLTPTGISQAQILAQKLKNKHFDLAYTSSLKRAKKTLTIVLKYHPHTQTIIDDRITERDYGDLVGLSKHQLHLYNPKLAAAYRRSYDFPPPNGESLKQVEVRVEDFIKDITSKMKQKNINVAVSCHGNSMRVIRRHFEKLSIKQMLLLANPLGTDYCAYPIT